MIHDYAAHLFRGEPYNLATHNGVILHKGSSRQVMHADQQAIPLVLDRPVMFAMMICLSDFEADMGATVIAPGSHRFPLPQLDADPAEQVKEIGSELVPLTAPAGSALFWESRTWHGQGGSTSDKARVSIGSIWAQHFVKPQDFFPAIVHDDVYETLTDADKEVLGFRVVREFGGAIGPRSPGDRRSNLNVRYPYIPELGKGGSKRAVPLDRIGSADVIARAREVAAIHAAAPGGYGTRGRAGSSRSAAATRCRCRCASPHSGTSAHTRLSQTCSSASSV